jgi:hypothetical protein
LVISFTVMGLARQGRRCECYSASAVGDVKALQGTRRQACLQPSEPHDIWLDNKSPVVVVNRPGGSGRPHWKPLTEQGVAAFQLFIEKDAFGEFSRSSIYKSWKLACQDAEVPFFQSLSVALHMGDDIAS